MNDYSTMKAYRCSKCGCRATSKGPGRSMHILGLNGANAFANWVTLLPAMMWVRAEDDPHRPGEKDLVFNVSMHKNDEKRSTLEGALRHFHAVMRECTEEELVAAFCQHSWELNPPTQVE